MRRVMPPPAGPSTKTKVTRTHKSNQRQQENSNEAMPQKLSTQRFLVALIRTSLAFMILYNGTKKIVLNLII